MHQAQNYIRTKFLTGDSISPAIIDATTLSSIQRSGLASCLSEDSAAYLYSAIVSYADAMNGIRGGYYSWATVKLYYSVFYSLRSILSSDDVCLFYIGAKPYSIHVEDEGKAKKESGNTHKVIIKMYESSYQYDPIVTQQIDMQNPLAWLAEKREQCNYKNARFFEPSIPCYYNKIMNDLSVNVRVYFQDLDFLYAFDKDHAIIALPTMIIKKAIDKYSARFNMPHEDVHYLSGLFDALEGDYSAVTSEIEKLGGFESEFSTVTPIF